MIDIKDIITLNDNNRYGVVSNTIYEGKKFYYLVDVENLENIKFCFEENNNDEINLVEVEYKNLIQKLIPLLATEIKDELNNLIDLEN